jgi:FtsH-binding integral membrane protein
VRLYGLVVAIYPRRLRKEYGADMKLVFNDLLEDPNMSRRRTWSIVLSDIVDLIGGLWLGPLFGFLVVLIWWVVRSDIYPFDPNLGLVLIAALFVAAGFTGTRRSGSFAGGMGAGFVAGLISAITVPGDYWLFGTFPFYDAISFVGTMAISAAVVMLLVTIGSELATFKTHRGRMRRGIWAFVGAWRRDSELSP